MEKKKILFWEALHRELLPSIKLFLNKLGKEKAGESINFLLFGEETKESKTRKNLSEKEEFLKELLFTYTEIQESLRRMELGHLLIKRLPEKSVRDKAGFTKSEYLRYHFENFMNETYIFQKRVEKLFREIEKKSDRKGFSGKKKEIESLRKRFFSAIETRKAIRGHHVHVARYDDEDLKTLRMLESVEDDRLLDLSNRMLERTRKKFSMMMINTKNQLEEAINEDLLSKEIVDFIFKDLLGKCSGKIIEKETQSHRLIF